MTASAFDTRADRLARAHAALGEAEAKVAGLTPLSVRRQAPTAEASSALVPVPPPLVSLFPRAELLPGSSVDFRGVARSSLALATAGAAMGAEGWCAVVGMPHVGAGALAGLGMAPSRTALIPSPGAQGARVLSALADGVDVIVLGAHLTLTPALWRSLTARSKTQGSVVLTVGEQPSGIRRDYTLSSTHRQWVGLTSGSGRLRARHIEVTARGRAIAGNSRVLLELPSVQGALQARPERAASLTVAAPVSRSHLSLVKKAG